MIEIKSAATLGKQLAVKREKDDDDSDRIICHLKFVDLLVDREQFDELCGQPIGWHEAFFDDFGAPAGAFAIGLPKGEWSVTGVVRSAVDRPERLNLLQAELTGVTLEPTKLGALLSGALAWKARGDEVEDVTDLLGQLVAIEWRLTDSGQQDAFKPSSGVREAVQALQDNADRHGTTMTMSTGGKEIGTIAPKAGRISSADEVMKLLRRGYHLRGAEPDYWIEKPDGSERQGVWLNAARSVLKHDLEPIGDGDTDEVGRWKLKGKAA